MKIPKEPKGTEGLAEGRLHWESDVVQPLHAAAVGCVLDVLDTDLGWRGR